jgi:benzoylformate decarboxylase
MSVWSEIDPMPPELAMIQIGLNDWDLAKNYSAEMAIRADVRETLRALTPALVKKGGKALKDRAEKSLAALKENNWTAKRKKLVATIDGKAHVAGKPINPDFMTLRIVESIPKDAVVVNESLTSGRLLNNLLAYRDRYGYHGLASGGIGWSVPASVGISMAQKDRPVVCIVGDGSAMYSIQALWSAAHHRLPVVFAILVNREYRILKHNLDTYRQRFDAASGKPYPKMDLGGPELGFVEMAAGMGVPGVRVTNPDEVAAAISQAFAAGGPRLVEIEIEGKR